MINIIKQRRNIINTQINTNYVGWQNSAIDLGSVHGRKLTYNTLLFSLYRTIDLHSIRDNRQERSTFGNQRS